ncbi:unnamed protein product, partial [Prorocentrum cordatum]
ADRAGMAQAFRDVEMRGLVSKVEASDANERRARDPEINAAEEAAPAIQGAAGARAVARQKAAQDVWSMEANGAKIESEAQGAPRNARAEKIAAEASAFRAARQSTAMAKMAGKPMADARQEAGMLAETASSTCVRAAAEARGARGQ